MAFFPLVGLAMASVPAAFIFIFYPFLGPFTGALAVALIFTLITGGLHLDGLADTVDGICGGKDKKEMLAIMRDSRIGAMGVIALLFVLSFKMAFLAEIWLRADKAGLLKAVFFFPVMGRWSMVSAAWLMPYARDEEGVGEVFAEGVSFKQWILASFFAAVITFFILGAYAVLFLPLVLLTTLLLIRYFRRRIGGVTGDVFGAINELMEALSLIYIFFYFSKDKWMHLF